MKIRKCVYVDVELCNYVSSLYPNLSFSESLCRVLIAHQILMGQDPAHGMSCIVPELEKYKQLELL